MVLQCWSRINPFKLRGTWTILLDDLCLWSERFFGLFGPAGCTKADAKFLKKAVPRDFKESTASALCYRRLRICETSHRRHSSISLISSMIPKRFTMEGIDIIHHPMVTFISWFPHVQLVENTVCEINLKEVVFYLPKTYFTQYSLHYLCPGSLYHWLVITT